MNSYQYPIGELLKRAGVAHVGSLPRSWARDVHRIRQQREGMLTERQADKWAVRFGLLPCEVWPEIYWATDDPGAADDDGELVSCDAREGAA